MNSFELSTINKKCNQQIINYVKEHDVISDIKRNVKSNNPFIFIQACRVLELLTDTLRSAVTSKKCFGTLAESHVEAPILTWGPLQFFSTSLAMRRAPPRRTNLLGERLKWRYMRKFTLCKFKCSEVS